MQNVLTSFKKLVDKKVFILKICQMFSLSGKFFFYLENLSCVFKPTRNGFALAQHQFLCGVSSLRIVEVHKIKTGSKYM